MPISVQRCLHTAHQGATVCGNPQPCPDHPPLSKVAAIAKGIREREAQLAAAHLAESIRGEVSRLRHLLAEIKAVDHLEGLRHHDCAGVWSYTRIACDAMVRAADHVGALTLTKQDLDQADDASARG